jgi:hypothetical protein
MIYIRHQVSEHRMRKSLNMSGNKRTWRLVGAKEAHERPLLACPPILSIPSCSPSRTSTPRTPTLPLRRLPTSSTSLRLGRIQLAFLPLSMLQLTRQIGGGESEMHKVAESSTVTLSVFILATTSFAEICHWRKFSVEWAACEM